MSGIDQERLRQSREHSHQLGEQLARVAGDIAETERRAADLYERLAQDRPERAEHFRAHAADARAFAEHEQRQHDAGPELFERSEPDASGS